MPSRSSLAQCTNKRTSPFEIAKPISRCPRLPWTLSNLPQINSRALRIGSRGRWPIFTLPSHGHPTRGLLTATSRKAAFTW